MIRKQPYTFYVLFVFLFLIPFGKAFAGWNNFIVNFDKSLYGKGPQTWQKLIVKDLQKKPGNPGFLASE